MACKNDHHRPSIASARSTARDCKTGNPLPPSRHSRKRRNRNSANHVPYLKPVRTSVVSDDQTKPFLCFSEFIAVEASKEEDVVVFWVVLSMVTRGRGGHDAFLSRSGLFRSSRAVPSFFYTNLAT